MAALSDYLESQIRAHLFRTATWAKPTALWVALYTAAPSDSGGGTEVTGGAYARVNLPPLDANWTAASGTDGHTDNAVAITYPQPTVNWGTVTHMGILDAATAGNLLVHGALAAPKIINSDQQPPSFPIGELNITFQ